MKRKLYRFVSAIQFGNDGTIQFEQKMNLINFFMFGIWAFLFKKKDKSVCHIDSVTSVETSISMMSGKLVKIFTNDVCYIFEMRSKEAFEQATNDIKNSVLSDKLDHQK